MGRVLGVLVVVGEVFFLDLVFVFCFFVFVLILNWVWDWRGKFLEESGSEEEIVEREESWDRVVEKVIGVERLLRKFFCVLLLRVWDKIVVVF